MARQTVWVLTLVLTCAPVLGASTSGAMQQGRSDKPQTAPAQAAPKDGREKAQAAPNKPDDRDRWKWWLYDRAELGITDQQSSEINKIFEATIPKLRETREELERSEDELSRTIKEHKADVAGISLLVDRVESARSQHAKMRILMLYRIDLLLSPEQRVKVEALRTRQDAARKAKEPSPGHRRYP